MAKHFFNHLGYSLEEELLINCSGNWCPEKCVGGPSFKATLTDGWDNKQSQNKSSPREQFSVGYSLPGVQLPSKKISRFQSRQSGSTIVSERLNNEEYELVSMMHCFINDFFMHQRKSKALCHSIKQSSALKSA